MKEFIERAKLAYGGEYIFIESVFSGNASPMDIVCPDHGAFTITPDNFLYNAGCYKCRNSHARGYPISVKKRYPERGTKRGPKPKVYKIYIHSVGSDFIKVGITEGCVMARWVAITRASVYDHEVIYTKNFTTRKLCLAVEKLIKSIFPMSVVPSGSMLDGSSETTFVKHLPEVISIIESMPAEPYGG